MRVFLAPYSMRVSAARHLSRALGGRRILPHGSRYRYRDGDVVINWGRSNFDQAPEDATFNYSVKRSVNKILSFGMFEEHGVPTVEWTLDKEQAVHWRTNGDVVVCREDVDGRGGSGVVVLTPDMPDPHVVPDVDLYTKYFKRKHEYRVHVFDGKVIDVQQKRRRRGMDANNYVRSYGNGWVFCRGGVEAPECVLDASIRAVKAVGLDFGGVDVGYNEHHNRACVFEVNSAPGIEGTTLQKYTAAIQEKLNV